MPWQRLVADVGGELLPDGRPAFREVVWTVPRQSGKTTLTLAWEVHRALMWGKPQTIGYTAQTGQDARMKLIEDQYDKILALTPLRASIRQAKRAMGATALIFKNGSRIDALASSAEAGHGKTLDLAVIDEAWGETEGVREQALLPTMATRSDAQLLIMSTAGKDDSIYLRRKVEAGRSAVKADQRSGVAYFEWSAPPEADADDETVWWETMPALGYTMQDVSAAAHARASMSDGDFRRAWLNQWVSTDERVISSSVWDAAQTSEIDRAGGVVFAADARPGLESAAIAMADSAGNVELIDHRDGPGWVSERLESLSKTHNARIVIDVSGPLGYIAAELLAKRVPVVSYSSRDFSNACAAFYSLIMDGKVNILTRSSLTKAVMGATRRKSGDAWKWDRYAGDLDISPLTAATLALGEAYKANESGEIGVMLI